MTSTAASASAAPSRRAHKHGEGSIDQMPDGRWRARLMVGVKLDGKLDRRTVYGKSLGEVHKKLAELRRRPVQGTLTDRAIDRLTVADFFTRWSAAAAGTIRATTWQSYADLIRRYVVADLGRLRSTSRGRTDLQRRA